MGIEAEQIAPCQWRVTREIDGASVVETVFVPAANDTAEAAIAALLDAESPDVDGDAKAVARAYLASTDWYHFRALDTHKPMPSDVKEARAKARAAL